MTKDLDTLAAEIEAAFRPDYGYCLVSPDNMRALLAERKQMKAALEWQPIETAPREHEIVWVGNENNTRLAFWKSGPENYTSLSSDTPDGGWIDYSKAESYQNVTSVQFMPTHWMHRPDPPRTHPRGGRQMTMGNEQEKFIECPDCNGTGECQFCQGDVDPTCPYGCEDGTCTCCDGEGEVLDEETTNDDG